MAKALKPEGNREAIGVGRPLLFGLEFFAKLVNILFQSEMKQARCQQSTKQVDEINNEVNKAMK